MHQHEHVGSLRDESRVPPTACDTLRTAKEELLDKVHDDVVLDQAATSARHTHRVEDKAEVVVHCGNKIRCM